jgi:predicted extracellular nuclease
VAHASCRDRALRLHTDEPPHQRAEPVGGTLKVASFNVLNSFKTIDTTSSGSSGPCGPSGTMDCRGADSEAELERQRAKIVAALTAMDPDVAGLIEIQNDADVTLAHLVEGLNAATAPGTYDYVRTGTIGTDAIKLAFVYKPATVELVGGHAVLDSTVDPRFEDTRSRPALAQTFLEKATGQKVTVSVNHFKSKGSACTGDPDRATAPATATSPAPARRRRSATGSRPTRPAAATPTSWSSAT